MSTEHETKLWHTFRHRVAATGALEFGFVMFNGFNEKRVWSTKHVLPSHWKVGGVYDYGLQISDVASEKCSMCDNNSGDGLTHHEYINIR